MMTITETKDFKRIAELNADVQNLHAKLYPEIFKPFNRIEMEKALENFLSDPNCFSYIVELNNVAIGSAVFFVKEAKENAFHYTIRTLYIDQISVLPEHQKTGAGKMLMQKAEQLARENSIKKIELDHWTANKVAATYFRKNGYMLYRERLFKILD
ncbi:GNAT family N-acetyltransferase [Fluviicola chungangensis]|uniref:GNAT family N-acetyltransferase n=1 Tax=Fluviicola chungangensis TaxID=2597671 RepID=A0A556N727_9FLAO|nr:GNAT family N-acetyltransferase [Fluviicola chungangensis]TSJ47992.1 GNAT family N-acetyltransferase [Fluviicola chungangensis]